MTENLLDVRNLKKHFPIYGGILRKKVGNIYAVDGVSFSVKTGETLGVVGESGSGKTTVGRTIVKLYEPTSGEILFKNNSITNLHGSHLKSFRKSVQMIFQDPFASLNPRFSIKKILEEPFIIHKVGTKKERHDHVMNLIDRVGLREDHINRYPHEFSGGQRQRIGIARAIALNPELIIADEPVSALDVSIQSQILNLLCDLQDQLKLTYIFISHDLSVVKHISTSIVVMYLGRIVEKTSKKNLFNSPKHPYTQALISAIPDIDPERRGKKMVLKGDIPSPISPPNGCHFHTRCPFAQEICKQESPELKNYALTDEHLVACHFTDKLIPKSQP